MKTSRYFALGYVLFVVLLTVVFYSIASLKKDVRREQAEQAEVIKKIAPFSVVVAEEGVKFRVTNYFEPRAVLTSRGDSAALRKDFIVRNDTLFLTKDMFGRKTSASIGAPMIRSIVANKNSRVTLAGLKGHELSIHIKNGRLYGNIDDTFSKLNIRIEGGRMSFRHAKVLDLHLHATGAYVNFQGGYISQLTADLDKGANLHTKAGGKVVISCDKNSRYNVRK